jgi:precorrin-6A/cobalt-precorrin-6A reductase
MRILILGGTAEARLLAERLSAQPNLTLTLSLAGRTRQPAPQPVAVRTGGFGGPAGLASYLSSERIDVLIDATHPYAAQMSANAAQAVASTGVAFIALRRPPWARVVGDRWIEVADVAEAVHVLGSTPRRVFVALGRKEVAPLCAAPQHHYLVRSVDPINPPLPIPHCAYVTGRGPFSEADERRLLEEFKADFVLAKNSGGGATYGKITAARALGLTVVMVRRPQLPDCASSETIDGVVAWLAHQSRPSLERGV